jgi:ketosteroid isomerase-like protein
MNSFVLVLVVFSARVHADHHEAGEVEAAVRTFYAQLSAGRFEEAFAHMKLGANGYLPDGILAAIPTEEVRRMAVNAYAEAREAGLEMNLRPEYLNVATHGNLAIATYLVDGTIKDNNDAEEERQVNRGTLVWQQTDQGWKIVHWHVSRLVEGDD